MAFERPSGLLDLDDPAPVACTNARGGSPFLLTGDHAGRLVPRRLGNLGLVEDDLARHIAWDIGIDELGKALAERLDAAFIAQRYSRLVIDCNRDPASPEAIPTDVDGTQVPGNSALIEAARRARIDSIHEPYHRAIAGEIAARLERGQETIFVALHSFTPALGGVRRPWDVGVLHGGGSAAFALRLLETLGRDHTLTVGNNEPYRLDATDHSVPRHAFTAALPYAEIEIRQDLLAKAAGPESWADLLATALASASILPIE